MQYGMQIEIEERADNGGRRKVWKWVRPTNGEPYRYGTEEEARRMLDICYPAVMCEGRRVRPFAHDEE